MQSTIDPAHTLTQAEQKHQLAEALLGEGHEVGGLDAAPTAVGQGPEADVRPHLLLQPCLWKDEEGGAGKERKTCWQ